MKLKTVVAAAVAMALGGVVWPSVLAPVSPAMAQSPRDLAAMNDAAELGRWMQKVRAPMERVLELVGQGPTDMASLEQRATRAKALAELRAWTAQVSAAVREGRDEINALAPFKATSDMDLPLDELQSQSRVSILSVLDSIDGWVAGISAEADRLAANEPGALKALRAQFVEGGIPMLQAVTVQLRANAALVSSDHPQHQLSLAIAASYDGMVVALRATGARMQDRPAPPQSVQALRAAADASEVLVAQSRRNVASSRLRLIGLQTGRDRPPAAVAEAIQEMVDSYEEAFDMEARSNVVLRSLADAIEANPEIEAGAFAAALQSLASIDEERNELIQRRLELISRFGATGAAPL